MSIKISEVCAKLRELGEGEMAQTVEELQDYHDRIREMIKKRINGSEYMRMYAKSIGAYPLEMMHRHVSETLQDLRDSRR